MKQSGDNKNKNTEPSDICTYHESIKDSSLCYVSTCDVDYNLVSTEQCTFHNNKLNGAVFRYADIRGADFSGCTLTGVDFRYAITDSETSFNEVLYDQYTIFPDGCILPDSARFLYSSRPPKWHKSFK